MTKHPFSDVETHVGAIVLCGGQSRRMGRSKAWLPFGDEVLVQRVVRRLLHVARPVVVVRAKDQTLPELPTQVLVTEDETEDRGPLQGIASGLAKLREIVDVAFVSSTDAPFVDVEIVRHLERLRGVTDDLVVPFAHGRHHPLAALFTLRVLPEIERMLNENHLRVTDLLARVHTRVVSEDELRKVDAHLRFLSNLNTPDEYEAALAAEVDPQGAAFS